MVALLRNLLSRAVVPGRTAALKERVKAFERLSPMEQEKELPSIYLEIEQYLVVADMPGRLSREDLRRSTRNDYSPLLILPGFALIFESALRQEILLGIQLLEGVLRRAIRVLGGVGENTLISALAWLGHAPNDAVLPLPFGLLEELPEKEAQWPALLQRFSAHLYGRLEKSLGQGAAQRLFENSYQDLTASYAGLETFPEIISFLPDSLFDAEKISLLSRNQIERVLLQKIEHLQEAQEKALQSAAELRELNLKLASSVGELQRALVIQEEFTSMVSHELRTPLTSIIGAAKMLQDFDDSLPPQKRVQFLEMIVTDSWRLTRLVSEILDLSRVQQQGVPLHYERLDLEKIAAAVIAGLRLANPDKTFEMKFQPEAKDVEMDRDRSQQIFINLLGNAAKYTPEGCHIALEAEAHEDMIVIRVIDSGPGIPLELQSHVFEPFYRTKDAINYKCPGTGLGLTITKAIVVAMGGRISVANHDPHGCVFTVSLPRREPLRQAA